MELKKYQKNTIETLENFLKELQKVGPKYAFMGITDKPYKSEAFGDVPFVCIKFLRGNGKVVIGFSRSGHVAKELPPALSHFLLANFINFSPNESASFCILPSSCIIPKILNTIADRWSSSVSTFPSSYLFSRYFCKCLTKDCS